MSDFQIWRATADEDAVSSTAILTIIGELDLSTAPLLREALTDCFPRANRIVIDARQVSFLDMTGAGLLQAAAHRAAETGRQLIVMPSAKVRQVLALVDIDVQGVIPLDAPGGRYVSVLCRAGHHDDCISQPDLDCACPCHP